MHAEAVGPELVEDPSLLIGEIEGRLPQFRARQGAGCRATLDELPGEQLAKDGAGYARITQFRV